MEGRMDYKDQKESLVMEMFIILIIVMASQAYTYVKLIGLDTFNMGSLFY